MEDVREIMFFRFHGKVGEGRGQVVGARCGDGVVERDGVVAQRGREEEGLEELVFRRGGRPRDVEVVEHDEVYAAVAQPVNAITLV